MSLKDQVSTILEEYPETRSDDNALTIMIWKRYYPQFVQKFDFSPEYVVCLNDLHRLPSSDAISRYRRMFAPLYPATPEVNAHRHRLQKEKRQEFGSPLFNLI